MLISMRVIKSAQHIKNKRRGILRITRLFFSSKLGYYALEYLSV